MTYSLFEFAKERGEELVAVAEDPVTASEPVSLYCLIKKWANCVCFINGWTSHAGFYSSSTCSKEGKEGSDEQTCKKENG